MSTRAESALIRYLAGDDEILTYIARQGLNLDVVPEPELREVVTWALTHLSKTGRAPSIEATKERWKDRLSDLGIEMDEEPEDPIESVVDKLKTDYVRKMVVIYTREVVTAVIEAAEEDRVDAFAAQMSRGAALSMSLQPATTQVDLRRGVQTMMDEYERVKASGNPIRGMTFGLPEVDAWTRGVWGGELCILAAPPKTGKSFFLNYVAYHEWTRGRGVGLYTLENTIETAIMRTAAIACGVDTSELMDGTLSAEDEDRLRTWVYEKVEKSDGPPLYVMNPESVMRTPEAIVQSARAHGVDSLIVDQLSHLEYADPKARLNRPTEIKAITEGLRTSISTGRHLLPCVMAHQINRDGMEYLRKTGRVEMDHLAEGAVERTADLGLALTASEVQANSHRCTLQGILTRRIPLESFELNWMPHVGNISVRGLVEL